LIAWVGVYWVGAHIVFWAQPRFRYALEVPMAILASFALITLFAALRERWRRRTAGATSS
jgi:asparagine N-glycosylation enzyme membrane subunit Stt3